MTDIESPVDVNAGDNNVVGKDVDPSITADSAIIANDAKTDAANKIKDIEQCKHTDADITTQDADNETKDIDIVLQSDEANTESSSDKNGNFKKAVASSPIETIVAEKVNDEDCSKDCQEEVTSVIVVENKPSDQKDEPQQKIAQKRQISSVSEPEPVPPKRREIIIRYHKKRSERINSDDSEEDYDFGGPNPFGGMDEMGNWHEPGSPY
uniref:Uncharacterized protein n=1 Tax=Panagrolaimus sp. ES5 TaxID=591445 RepID=A0AC34GC09_9BILA